MRTVYIDIDSLRPDHLGCYGYHRNTSPNIDKIAEEGVCFNNCYASDSPCLPSRAAMSSGKCGIRNGAVNHGGEAAEYYIDPEKRNFRTLQDNFILQLRNADIYPVSVSPFAERHSAFWQYNGYREMYNSGRGGEESAEEIMPLAHEWLDRKGTEDNWFLYINIWDPHTPYRAPEELGNPFKNDPPPSWMNEETRLKSWNNYGPGSAQEPGGDYTKEAEDIYPRMPSQIDSMESYKKWIDGYDCGVYYADKQVGELVRKLDNMGVLDETMIIITADHGENLGELSVYGDHQSADYITNRVPMILRHPKGLGGKGRLDSGLHYQFDIAATILEMNNLEVPETWDGKSFFNSFRKGESCGRDSLVLSHCAWACQRAARWDDFIMIKTYHSGFKNYPEIMLFNLKDDPHEENNLADKHPELVQKGLSIIENWHAEEMKRSDCNIDPLWTVMKEGGPFHANFNDKKYNNYLKRLENTGRKKFIKELENRKKKILQN